jgi:hypothetical protein
MQIILVSKLQGKIQILNSVLPKEGLGLQKVIHQGHHPGVNLAFTKGEMELEFVLYGNQRRRSNEVLS